MGDTVCMLSPGTGCQINRSRRPHTAFSGYDINDASAGIAAIDGTAGTFDHLDFSIFPMLVIKCRGTIDPFPLELDCPPDGLDA